MLNIMKVGRKISELRREKNMTQMELAERLNISYQAVSNWERGNSMPDISKLPELAQLFGVTIDDLLGETSELINHAAENKVEEYLEEHEVPAEELAEAAPILKPRQVEQVFEKAKVTNLADLVKLLPFLDEKTVDELAKKMAENGDTGIERLFPFVSRETVEKLAEASYEAGGVSKTVTLFPFMSDEQLNAIAQREFAQNGLKNMALMAPFLDEEYLSELAGRAMAEGKTDELLTIAPFLDEKILAQYIKAQFS